MPLVETVSLLVSLASALQSLRGTRPATDSPAQEDSAARTLVAYDFVRGAAERSAQQLENLQGRLLALVAAAGLSLVGAVAIVRLAEIEPDIESPLFLVPLAGFVVIAIAAMLIRALTPPSATALPDAYGGDEVLDVMLRGARRAYETTQAHVRFTLASLVALSLLFGAQVLLLALWIPLAQ